MMLPVLMRGVVCCRPVEIGVQPCCSCVSAATSMMGLLLLAKDDTPTLAAPAAAVLLPLPAAPALPLPMMLLLLLLVSSWKDALSLLRAFGLRVGVALGLLLMAAAASTGVPMVVVVMVVAVLWRVDSRLLIDLRGCFRELQQGQEKMMMPRTQEAAAVRSRDCHLYSGCGTLATQP